MTSDSLNFVNYIESSRNLSKDHMGTIQPGRIHLGFVKRQYVSTRDTTNSYRQANTLEETYRANEKLRTIGIGPRIRHGKNSLSFVLELKVFVLKIQHGEK